MNAAKTTKAILNTGARRERRAITEPIATPTTAGSVQSAHHVAGSPRPWRDVREIGAERGRHDDRERGADAKLHAHIVGHAEHAEDFVQHRHDDGAAADAEQPGEDAGDNAARPTIAAREQSEFAERRRPAA